MSITQAITNVQWFPGLPAGLRPEAQPEGTGNGHQLFVPHQLGANARISLPISEAMPEVWRPIWDAPSTVVFNPAAAPAVRVGGIWLLQETVNALPGRKRPWTSPAPQ